MLRWALIFLVVAIIAAALGFGGIAGDAAYIAKILFYIFKLANIGFPYCLHEACNLFIFS